MRASFMEMRGGAGSRTPVRREDPQNDYMRILLFDLAPGNSSRQD